MSGERAPGGASGGGPEDSSSSNVEDEARRRGGIVGNAEIEQVLAEALEPVLHQAYVDVQDHLFLVVLAFAEAGASHAAQLVANQAFNDAQDLLYDLWCGRGRSAARATRALYEHTVNFCEVAARTENADRYEAHAAVAAQLEARLAIGVHRLRGKAQKVARHALHKLARDSRQQYDAALAAYGARFRRDWAPDKLRDRAARHGLDGDYDTYRLTSAVLHGSAGGAMGTLSSAYPAHVHRTGPALALCVLAYHEGLRFFARFLTELGRRYPGVDVSALAAAVEALLERWPQYREVVLGVDSRLWPPGVPPRAAAGLALYPSGSRWYYHQPQLGLMWRADPPDGAEEHERRTREELPGAGRGRADDAGRPVTAHMMGVTVNPRPGSRPIPAAALLVPRRAERLFEEPSVVNLEPRGTA